MKQQITPRRTVFFCGETVTFTLTGVPDAIGGRAMLRTTLGGVRVARQETIDQTETGRTPRNGAWHDFPMPGRGGGEYSLTLPLCEEGVFEAKCCFIPGDGGAVCWPEGDNFRVKVSASDNAAGCGIYSCFVRQWGKIKEYDYAPELPDLSEPDREGFTIVPPSGTFRQVIANLDHIFDRLQCRILQLLPIHPVPTTYGRMGRYGSPFASLDYFAVDPALAEFDRSASPMEQFVELVDAVHARGGRIFLDLPANHTGWASKLQNEHPDYFLRDDNGEFHSPGAWGVTWSDLCALDYRRPEVHCLMAKIFLFWCRLGVDGFRCDAGYMVPEAVWRYIVAKVRRSYPQTTFLLEGLGGPPKVQERLLGDVGLDWGYSELFQNYTRDAIDGYYRYMSEVEDRCGTLVCFAETHDNDRLAAKGKAYARSRFLVNALLGSNGTFGFVNGAEFYAAEKIDVHGCGALNFGNPDNLCALVSQLNRLAADHPAFGPGVKVELVQCGGGNTVAARRYGPGIPELLVLINLDCSRSVEINFRLPERRLWGFDVLSGREMFLPAAEGGTSSCHLEPGEAVCLSFEHYRIPETIPAIPDRVRRLRAAAMAQRAAAALHGYAAAASADGELLQRDPFAFVQEISSSFPPPLTIWRYPQDLHRNTVVPPGNLLLLQSEQPFRVKVCRDSGVLAAMGSLPLTGGGYFILTGMPENATSRPIQCKLHISVYCGDSCRHEVGVVQLLPEGRKRRIALGGAWDAAGCHCVFASNCYGSYAMFSAEWGRLNCKYDAMLAVNPDHRRPEDRIVLFSNCRAWLQVEGFSREITGLTLENYTAHPDNRACWNFQLPDGRGDYYRLSVMFRMARNRDAVELIFRRPAGSRQKAVNASLILRPELECRCNHHLTRAGDGPERVFPAHLHPGGDFFEFSACMPALRLQMPGSEFHLEEQWRYGVDLPGDRYYGMGDKTDLYSPGYFIIPLASGEEAVLTAAAGDASGADWPELEFPAEADPGELAVPALSRYVVVRDGLNTVMAGYPWFLDWGRDTLIALRGLVRFPEFAGSCSRIIRRFAAFEKGGTIPNMICGGNDSNRDTSDAPLWLIIAARDYLEATGDREFLKTDCGGRTPMEIFRSIADNYRRGTANGIIMDPESKLIFSPSHFTWMDTNYPAGTPREGYPIEIQALWYAALKFLGEDKLAEEVGNSIEKYYFAGELVADCLHCRRGVPAAAAEPDDHTRCNMLLAVTMGAVRSPEKIGLIIGQADTLIVPGAIRTLDDVPVTYRLPVNWHGRALNDPGHPYWGHYRGPEDTERKPAYHNGTAWGWPFPAYCEAIYKVGGEKCRRRALSLLMSAVETMENGIVGQMSEIRDGDMPHRDGGCLAQAWSISEFYRVYKLLV